MGREGENRNINCFEMAHPASSFQIVIELRVQ